MVEFNKDIFERDDFETCDAGNLGWYISLKDEKEKFFHCKFFIQYKGKPLCRLSEPYHKSCNQMCNYYIRRRNRIAIYLHKNGTIQDMLVMFPVVSAGMCFWNDPFEAQIALNEFFKEKIIVHLDDELFEI